MQRIFFVFILCIGCISLTLAQEEDSDENFTRRSMRSMIGYDNKSVIYTQFAQGGFAINTNGYSLNFRRLWAKSTFWEQGFEIDAALVRHPKEVSSRTGAYGGRAYVFGKINTLFNIRVGYGRNIEIADKRDIGSMEINYFFYTGASIGLLKPVWIEYQKDFMSRIEKVRYEPQKHESEGLIYGGLPFTYGWKKVSVRPGIYLKTGINFDFAFRPKAIGTVELGVLFNYFFVKLPIFMEEAKNKSLFTGFYASINFGKRWN